MQKMRFRRFAQSVFPHEFGDAEVFCFSEFHGDGGVGVLLPFCGFVLNNWVIF